MSKREPTLEDLGLDVEVKPSDPSKISIEQLQRESEIESASERPHPSSQPEASENLLGVVGFTLSLISFVTLGWLSPIALIISGSAMSKKPRGLATAGVVLSGLQTIVLVAYFTLVAFGFFAGAAARLRDKNAHEAEMQKLESELREQFPDLPESGQAPPESFREKLGL